MTDYLKIIRILNELSEDENGESDIEEEELVDDSDEDPDYVQHGQNLLVEKEVIEVIRNIEIDLHYLNFNLAKEI